MKYFLLLLVPCVVLAEFVVNPNDVCTVPLDMMLVLDGSNSIDYSSWQEVKQFAADITKTTVVSPTGTHIGIVQFSSTVRVEDPLDGDEAETLRDITNMRKMSLNTAIARGIDLGQTELDTYGRASVPHTMILMTDGVNNEPGSPIQSANNAKAKGTEIFVIGVGPDTDPTELKPLASDPLTKHYFTPSSFAELQEVLKNISQYTCDFFKCSDSTGSCEQVPRGTPGAGSKQECESSCKKTGGDYYCNIELLTCQQGPAGGGVDLPACELDCQPHTPAVLVGSWRGVEINSNFTMGEFDFVFNADNVTIASASLNLKYRVRSNGSELTLIDDNGAIRKAYYTVTQGPVTMLATLALGAANSAIPLKDFDTAMETDGDLEFTLASCLDTAKACSFGATNDNDEERRQWSSVQIVPEDEEDANTDEEELGKFDLEFNFLQVDPAPADLCSVPADIMFVIDGSGSISTDDWKNMRDFTTNLTSKFNVTANMAHVGVFEFSGANQGVLVDKLDDSAPSVDAKIAAMTNLGGRTAIGDGIKNAQTQLAAGRASVPHLMIIMTDGIENEDTHPIQMAADARAAGTEIVVLAIGKNVDLPSLTAVASQPSSSHLYNPTDYAALEKYILSVVDSICPQPIYMCQNQTTVNDTPTANGTCVQVAPGTPGATSKDVCNTTCGAHPPPPPPVVDDKYLCDNQTLQCMKVNASTPGAQTLQTCNQTCGHHSPIALTGEWRGIEISTKYLKGEFDLNITQFDMTLRDSAGAISYGYVIAQSPFQFGIDYKTGSAAGKSAIGMFLPSTGPETEFITLAISAPGVTTLPLTFEECLSDANTIVLNMVKCLAHKPCDFSAAMPAPPSP